MKKILLFLSVFCWVMAEAQPGFPPIEFIRKRNVPDSLQNKYDGIGRFHKGYATADKNQKWGLVDERYQLIIPMEYDFLDEFSDKNEFIAQKNEKWGVIDLSNTTIIPFIYEDFVSKDTIISAKKDQKWGVIDKNHHIIIPFEYDKLYIDRDQHIYAEKNGQKGYINYQNQPIIWGNFDYVLFTGYAETGFIVKKDNLYGVANMKNEIVVPIIYDDLDLFDEGKVFRVEKNEKWGVINSNHQIITPIIYDWIYFTPTCKYILATKNGKSGVLNHAHQVVIPFEYDNVSRIYDSDEMVEVKRNGKYGILKMTNEVIVPIEYDWIYTNKFRFTLRKHKKTLFGTRTIETEMENPYSPLIEKRNKTTPETE